MSRLLRRDAAVLALAVLVACSGGYDGGTSPVDRDESDGPGISPQDREAANELWAGISQVGHDTMCQNLETPEGRLEAVEYMTGPEMGSNVMSEERAEQVMHYLRTEKC